jgi:hypothetical protein
MNGLGEGSGFESNRAGNWNTSTYGANAGRTAQGCVIFDGKHAYRFDRHGLESSCSVRQY